MFYPIALFAILFFDFVVIMLKIKYAAVNSHRTTKVMRRDHIYSDILARVSDTKFTGDLREMKIIKMVHREQRA